VFHFPGIAKELFLQLRQYCRSLSRANELGLLRMRVMNFFDFVVFIASFVEIFFTLKIVKAIKIFENM
jgi:hypothetical protein